MVIGIRNPLEALVSLNDIVCCKELRDMRTTLSAGDLTCFSSDAYYAVF